ncbi:hypothetical protein Acsp04_15990 [Actinomadura sp. NBRC 104425]|uniref:hypothetical protein n=1 Tax=Actinomadura sp. NBRC 104425 TaxID=3032204 RepID=UPI0024A1A957|nr:hypothetical protein [Actinomadura sp. NBRC 104425]GLZ11364.1 hypothetical protein Acsp04_15990 [Actinomadura sp. NBRC 104425]
MIGRLAAVLAAALLLACLGAPAGPAAAAPSPAPHEETRFARVAAELAEDPLSVDMYLADAFSRADRRRIKAEMAATAKRIGVPVYVVVAPNPMESESYGEDEAFLFGLHERVGRNGLYVLVDEHGHIESVAFGVPRRIPYAPSKVYSPADLDAPMADVPARLRQLFDSVASAPSAPASTPTLNSTPPPFGQEHPPLEAEFWGPFLTGLLLVGPFGALLLFALIRAPVAGVRALRARSGTPSRGETKPSVRSLRVRAARALGELRDMLPDHEESPGHGYAARAYDAAQILFDDVAEDPADADEAVLDLVWAVVLARQGREVLDGAKDRPSAPCFVNPLHEPSAARRKIKGHGRRPVCADCAAAPPSSLAGRTLRVPGGRLHHGVPGRWSRFASAAHGRELPSVVLESLGVD